MSAERPLGRLIALALLLALAGAYWGFGIQPILQSNGLAEARLDDLHRQIERLQRVDARLRSVQSAGPELDRLAMRLLLEGDSPTRADAEMQNAIDRAVQTSALQLESLEPEGVRDDDPAGSRRLRIKGSGSLEALQTFLYLLESAPPVLIVEEMHVRARSVAMSGNQPLELELLLLAFAKPELAS